MSTNMTQIEHELSGCPGKLIDGGPRYITPAMWMDRGTATTWQYLRFLQCLTCGEQNIV